MTCRNGLIKRPIVELSSMAVRMFLYPSGNSSLLGGGSTLRRFSITQRHVSKKERKGKKSWLNVWLVFFSDRLISMKARCRKQEEEVTNPNKRSKLLLLFFFAFPKQTDLDVKIKNPFYGILYSIKEVEKRQRKRQEKKQNNYSAHEGSTLRTIGRAGEWNCR